MERASASNIDSDNDDCEEGEEVDETAEGNGAALGARADQCKPGTRGISHRSNRRKGEDDMLECMQTMAKSFGAISSAIAEDSSREIQDAVRAEVATSIQPALQRICDLKGIVAKLLTRKK